MEKMKYYTVILDGIDKSGKDTIAKYVWLLDKRLNVFVRGWPSLVAYAKKFKRNVNYALPTKKALYVHLTVDKQDWDIRCHMTNEAVIDYTNDVALFDDAFCKLAKNKYYTLTFNTSNVTAFTIAKAIVAYIHSLNN